MLHIAALASGNGTNVSAILRAVEEGRLDARVVMVLSNNPEAGVLERARARGVPVWAHSHRKFASREDFDRAMLEAISESGADTVALAGYMRILSPLFVRAFPGRVLNIHPAVLPSFPGARAGTDALAYGVRFSGVTVHFVDEIMDNGPVIIQAAVPVGQDDTEEALMRRIHALEHRVYPQALQWLAEDRLRVEGRRVRLLPAPDGKGTIRTASVSAGAGSAGEFLAQKGREGRIPEGEGESPEHAGAHALASFGVNGRGPWMVSPPLEEF